MNKKNFKLAYIISQISLKNLQYKNVIICFSKNSVFIIIWTIFLSNKKLNFYKLAKDFIYLYLKILKNNIFKTW